MTIGLITVRERLRECAVFSALNNAELEKIASLVSERKFEAGDTIFNSGDSANELFVIQEGKIALQIAMPKPGEAKGKKITIDIVAKDEALGWAAVVEPYVYTFTATCLQNVRALSVNGKTLRRLLQDNPKTGYTVVSAIAKVVASRLDATRQLLISEREAPA